MKPKRKRGYHRALKRNEPWALIEKGTREILNRLVSDTYCPQMKTYILTESPFMSMINKKEK